MNTIFKAPQLTFQFIKNIVQFIFSVPCSNAYVKRVFSHMNDLRTDEKNGLGVNIIKAEFVIRNNLPYSGTEFFEIVKH